GWIAAHHKVDRPTAVVSQKFHRTRSALSFFTGKKDLLFLQCKIAVREMPLKIALRLISCKAISLDVDSTGLVGGCRPGLPTQVSIPALCIWKTLRKREN